MQKYLEITSRLWSIFKPFHKHIYTQVVLVFVFQLLSMSITILNSQLINHLVAKKLEFALGVFVLWALVTVIMNIIFYIQNHLREKNLDQNVAQHLQEYSLRKILGLTIEQHVEDHSAIKLQIISKGESSADNIINILFTNILPTVLYTLIALATLSFYNLYLGIITSVVIIVLFTWAYFFRKFHNPYVQKNRDNWVMQNKIRTETFTHLSLAKSFAKEDFFIKKYIDRRKKIVEHHLLTRDLTTKHTLKRSSFQDLSELFSLGIASVLFLKGWFPIGTLYLVLSVSSRVYYNMNSFSSALRDMPIWFLDVEKYLETVEKVPSFDELGATNVQMNEDIIFKDLSFSYPHSTRPVLESISFHIPKHKTTALVGESGSGKSTISRLLLRSYDYSTGSIKIGETELSTINAHHLREHIGYVEQHVDLLDDSIKENIIFGVKDRNRGAAEKKLEEVARLSRIDQFYHRLGDKKFDTMVGERGIKLSGGERQRIGIARAIIKDPEILIFDEATSSLDTENEAKVMEAINEVSKGKTTIIIAHRLSTVRDADKIIVMDKGKIVGEGTHDELLKENKTYQNLVAHQV